ncbi:MAG: NADH-quinone oxidoreductase subunit H [Cytophagaceae bacterium]|jgi:NADH-quinone oxidoreductase subunit H|nr:NADH-quinone oxidoreductase subunit H [Cytophagaceae bacterium]
MISFALILSLILSYAILILWTERKLAAFAQDRLGPMEVGKYGLMQSFADLIKLFQKEDIVPNTADRRMFMAAPIVIFVSIFAGFAALPLWGEAAASIDLGLFYLMTIVSLEVLGLIMAGWGSGSKFPLYGAMRAVSQMLSYEIPLTLSILCVVVCCGSFNLYSIGMQQGGFSTEPIYLLGFGPEISHWSGFLAWNIFRSPALLLAFIVFFISSLAECNRAPFDIPEAESELVGGFHTEYSGFRFAILFLGEYAMMLLMAFLGAILFLGSWNTPFPNIGPGLLGQWTSGSPGTLGGIAWGIFWLGSKTAFLLCLQILARWTYPRLRVDQLMYLCWKVLLPFGLLALFLSILTKAYCLL